MRLSSILAATAVCACEPRKIEIASEPGDLVVVASVSDSGALGSIGILGADTSNFELDETSRIAGFRIPANQALGPDGTPITQSDREYLSAGSIREAPTNCGVCTFLTENPPFVLFAGDRCPLPDFAERSLDGERPDPSWDPILSEVSKVLTIDSRKSCEVPEEPLAPAPLRADLTWPEADGEPITAVAASSLGEILLLAWHSAWIFDPSGGRIEVERPTRGPALAVESADAGFIVASLNPDLSGSTEYHHVSRNSFTSIEAGNVLDQAIFRPTVILRRASGSYLLGGRGATVQHSEVVHGLLAECELIAFRLDCRIAWRETNVRANILDLIEVSGRAVAVSDVGLIVERASGELELQGFEGNTSGTMGSAIAMGTKVVLCVEAEGFAIVQSLDLEARGEWEVLGQAAGWCRGLVRISSGARFAVGPRAIDVSPAGVPRDSGPLEDLLGLPPDSIQRVMNLHGSDLVLTRSGRLLAGNGDGEPRHVYGDREPEPTVAWSIVPSSSGGYWVPWSQPSELWELDASGHVLARRALALGPEQVIHAAAADGGTLVLGGYDSILEKGFLRRLDPASLLIEEVSLPERALDRRRVLDLVSIERGGVLAIGDDWKAFRVLGSSAEVVPLSWDDPATPEIEVEIDGDDYCASKSFGRAPLGTLAHGLLAADAKGGVGFLSGCRAALFRVYLAGAAPRGIRVSPPESSLRISGANRSEFAAVRALGPGHLIAGGRGKRFDVGQLTELKAKSGGRFDGGEFDGFPSPRPFGLATAAGELFDILGNRQDLVTIYSEENGSIPPFLDAVHASSQLRFPAEITAAARGGDGRIVLASRHGRLYVTQSE
ncbi:MAG: hypothetical protein HYV07_27880 [Deltaproteobacteria bacterium]|nr:hypothetical protein [Deltaproteobacteria bacterium]